MRWSPQQQLSPCGINLRGVRVRHCVEGRFGPYSDCVDPDQCLLGATERRACGLNPRGLEEWSCPGGCWVRTAACRDPDVCVDATEERAPCGLGGDGVRVRTCRMGQWEDGPCSHADCHDGAIREQVCPDLDGNLVERCAGGQWTLVTPCGGQ